MSARRGAYRPGAVPVDIELVYVASPAFAWAGAEIDRIRAANRTPLVTIEQIWDGHPDPARWRAWRRVLAEAGGAVWVRYEHEANGVGWYPWQGDPARHVRDWSDFAAAMPPNVVKVWSPNVRYPGDGGDLVGWWPQPGAVDAVGIDGYARDGEAPADLFGPTLSEARALPGAGRLPVLIAETACPRGVGQAAWARALGAWADRERLEAVVWFSANKAGQGPDERDWRLTDAAARAFLGGRGRGRREPRERTEG